MKLEPVGSAVATHLKHRKRFFKQTKVEVNAALFSRQSGGCSCRHDEAHPIIQGAVCAKEAPVKMGRFFMLTNLAENMCGCTFTN